MDGCWMNGCWTDRWANTKVKRLFASHVLQVRLRLIKEAVQTNVRGRAVGNLARISATQTLLLMRQNQFLKGISVTPVVRTAPRAAVGG